MPDTDQPIAIVGMGCRFPGASNLQQFWTLLHDERDVIREVPPERWKAKNFYDANPLAPGKMNTKWGGFLDRVDDFDPYFFGISPREATCMDPQQRLLLEVAWEALEDGGQVAQQLAGSSVGVFIGLSSNDYGRSPGELATIEPYMGTGNANSIAANRLSYMFDFRGPSLTVDTACSSSLVAVHLACTSIRSGESSMALAGGANIILSPGITIAFTKAGMMSPDGQCKAFDAGANGYVRGEGVGAIVLKPLSSAIIDGDPIYAVILGTAMNQDGRSNGLTAPNRQSQETVIRSACSQAGMSPADLDYVEAHGTGTALGDAIETRALANVLGEARQTGRRCRVGSVKTNIGHLEAAAGIAGLIKAALVLKHRCIPASLHFTTPNPLIQYGDLPIVVQSRTEAWPESTRKRFAGVNSFGFGGTNAHVILGEAPADPMLDAVESVEECHLLPISARAPDSIRSLAESYRLMLKSADAPAGRLGDACFTASIRRSHHDHRLAIVGRTREEMAEKLDRFLHDQPTAGVFAGQVTADRKSKLAFVFPGQGTRLHGAGRQLFDSEPHFRKKLEECDELFKANQKWSIIDEIRSEVDRLDETEFAQPVVFALQTALMAMWKARGVAPHAIVGHSVGEVAAAHAAGVLSLPEAVRIIYHRARLMQRLTGRGRMAILRTSSDEARHLLEGYDGKVGIAACNAAALTVLSGSTADLREILATRCGTTPYEYLPVNYAFHSEQMSAFHDEFMNTVGRLNPQPASIPMYSTVTGEIVAGQELDVNYWWTNIRQMVRFADAVDHLLGNGFDTFLEISAHPTLLPAIAESAGDLGKDVLLIPSLRQGIDEMEQVQGSVARLYVAGRSVSWRKSQFESSRHVPLPLNPWKRETFWHPAIIPEGTPRVRMHEEEHPLLGWRLATAQPVWETTLELSKLPYLAEHQMQGAIVVPGAAYLEAVLSGAARASEAKPRLLSNVRFERPLVMPLAGACKLQTILTPVHAGAYGFSVHSQSAQSGAGWLLHATGLVECGDDRAQPTDDDFRATLIARCPDEMDAEDFYGNLQENGMEYGPSFQSVDKIWKGEDEVLARILPPDSVASESSQYWIHPAVLDACGQVLLALAKMNGEPLVPIGISLVRLYEGTGSRELWAHASLPRRSSRQDGYFSGNVRLLDEEGRLIALVEGLQLQSLPQSGAASAGKSEDWLYEIQWREQTVAEQRIRNRQPQSWLILADECGAWRSLVETLVTPEQPCIVLHAGSKLRRHPAEGNAIHYDIRSDRSEDVATIFENEFASKAGACTRIVHLWSLNSDGESMETIESLRQAQQLGVGSVLRLVQEALTAGMEPRLWLVTRGVQNAGTNAKQELLPVQAPLCGLSRVIANEHPELRSSIIDLPASFEDRDLKMLAEEILNDDNEDQIAIRDSRRYVARLARTERVRKPKKDRRNLPLSCPYRVGVATKGDLDTLTFEDAVRTAPGPNEIEIEVYAAGLNFRDVLKALGIYPGADRNTCWLGDECAGKVVSVGGNVDQFRPGDNVIAMASSCLAKYVTTSAYLACHKPARLGFEEAAGIPVVFLTSYYALHHVAHLKAGEKILIHAAAGGVGLAAVQLAQQAGAEIFATAGSDAKRAYLRGLGIEHVFDSRSLGFADDILRITGGKGVDVVLNSLAGTAIGKSLSVLAPFGRFVEIGKRDIYENSKIGLQPFQNNLSFTAIDMEKLVRGRPELFVSLFREVMARFANDTLQPVAYTEFSASDIVSAFRYLAQAMNTGKVVITFPRAKRALSTPDESSYLRPDRTYLITGGLGQLGSLVARWMVEHGARNLALLGRKTRPTELVTELRAASVRVETIEADVADPSSLHQAFQYVRSTMPELAGIVHAAGVLRDKLLLQLDDEDLWTVMAPKLLGARNLHYESLTSRLDFFVLFSSVSAPFGTPGQANYAAGNAFLGALAQYRRQHNLPAISINWGPWDEIGMAATTMNRKFIAGIQPIPPSLGLDLLEEILRADMSRPVVANLDWPQWLKQYGTVRNTTLFSDFRQASQHSNSNHRISALRKKINDAEPVVRQELIMTYMANELARVLQVDVSRIDTSVGLHTIGLDSMMAVEYKTRLEYELGCNLPIVRLLNGPSISEVASFITEILGERATLAATPSVMAAASVGTAQH